MKMNFEKLLNDGKIEKIEKNLPEFEKVDNDIQFAEEALKLKNFEWAMVVAYNAVMRAGMKCMAFFGYRAIGKEHHKHVFEFLSECEIDRILVKYFDRIRRKRNDFVYRDTSYVSEPEAFDIVSNAKLYVHKIRTFVLKKRT